MGLFLSRSADVDADSGPDVGEFGDVLEGAEGAA